MGFAMYARWVIAGLLIVSPALAQDDNDRLCLRGAKIISDHFNRANPDESRSLTLRDVKLAFPTIDGVICQAWFDFAGSSSNQTFPVRPAADGKIRVCNRLGRCTAPLD